MTPRIEHKKFVETTLVPRIKKLLKKGYPRWRISSELSIPSGSLSGIMNTYRILIEKKINRYEQVPIVKSLILKGFTDPQICKKLNLREKQLRYIIDRYRLVGLVNRIKRRKYTESYFDKVRELVDKKLTRPQICHKLNIPETKLSYILEQCNLKMKHSICGSYEKYSKKELDIFKKLIKAGVRNSSIFKFALEKNGFHRPLNGIKAKIHNIRKELENGE